MSVYWLGDLRKKYMSVSRTDIKSMNEFNKGVKDTNLQRSLSDALYQKNYTQIDSLLAQDVTVTYKHLKISIENKDMRSAQMLIDVGVRMSYDDVHELIENDDSENIYFLLKAGIPEYLFTNEAAITPMGKTAKDVAESSGNQSLLEVLKASTHGSKNHGLIQKTAL